jgi:hypothetical protein
MLNKLTWSNFLTFDTDVRNSGQNGLWEMNMQNFHARQYLR